LRGFIFTRVLLKIPFKLASWKNALLFVTVTEDEMDHCFSYSYYNAHVVHLFLNLSY